MKIFTLWNTWVRLHNIRTVFCLCRFHLRTCFPHFRFNCRALTRSLNWTSNQSSHSHRRSRRQFNMLNRANCHWRESDKSRRVEHTKQTSPTDAHRRPWCVPALSSSPVYSVLNKAESSDMYAKTFYVQRASSSSRCSASSFYIRTPASASATSHACVMVLLWINDKDWHERESIVE